MTERYDTELTGGPADPGAFSLDPSDPAYAGQAAYTRRTLRAYDPVVVKFSNSVVWRCPARKILAHHQRFVSEPHLDVGPGTGYYLDRCRFSHREPQLTLLDANAAVLRYAGHRLRRYQPTLHAANALEPIDLPVGSFGSVGLSYVLHCLPGAIEAKAVVFDNVIPLVAPGGVVFGATILGRGVHHARIARRLLPLYNRKGLFSNEGDDLDGLRRALAGRFDRFRLDVTGAVALFAGWVP